jgi:hypothetical protein
VSLGAVLVDRARPLRKSASSVKVGGRTTFADSEPGTWFAARLMMPTATPESMPAGFISKRVVLVPTLICDTEDDQGDPVVLAFNDMVEVESEDLGAATWQVTAEPEPFRKKQGIIGYSVNLKRVETGDFMPRVAAA